MEQRTARELRNAAHVALRQHFIGHGRIRHIGHAGAETGLDAFLVPEVVDFMGDIVADEGAEVAGMVAFPALREHQAHIGIHVVHAGDAGGEQAAAAHHDVYILQADALFLEGAEDGG